MNKHSNNALSQKSPKGDLGGFISKKEIDILNAGQKLFYKYGVKKVTVEEVCTEANVSKMTFYKYFPNKIELTKKVLDHIFEARWNEYRKIMDDESIPFPERLKKAISLKKQVADNASKEFLVDLFKYPDNELKEHINNWYEYSTKQSVEMLEEAKKQGYVKKEINPVLLLALFDKLDDVSVDDRVLNEYGNLGDLSDDLATIILYGICEE